jgi:hypothetical protein
LFPTAAKNAGGGQAIQLREKVGSMGLRQGCREFSDAFRRSEQWRQCVCKLAG